ncbi:L,D-transpeptidase [Anabaena sp. CCY 0017]|uniref:L,D-transpeptidase n=1 Tax=Anabaena sp. CCY 0017 TaxID=3103866 RepID=UPI0039C73F22
MQRWIRSTGTFCTGVVLAIATLVSCPPPTTGDSNSAIVNAAPPNNSFTIAQRNSKPRRIEISLSEQRLRAWEGKKLIYSYRVSTGKRSTPTPTGSYRINSKHRVNRMRGRGYDIPDVPYAMYYHRGYAIHGAYWHNNFGTPMSRGCTNLPVSQARKLYNWASVGTLVVVRR